MAIARIYQNGKWVPVNQGSPEMVSHDYLEQELARKADFDHFHDERYQKRKRWSLGMVSRPTGTGDYVMGFGSSGTVDHPQWVLIGGSYPATGALTLENMDLVAGTPNWRVRAYFIFATGDQRDVYAGLIAANLTGTYGLASSASTVAYGLYAEGKETGDVLYPRTVGDGSTHRVRSYVTPWMSRQQCVDTGKSVFIPYHAIASAITSVGWFAEGGFEFEPY